MRKRNNNLPLFENIEITDLAAEGKAIAKINIENSDKKDLIIFVENCIPGDIVDIQVKKKQRNFMEGIPVKFHKLSEKRINAKCIHFGTCGGCKWQSLPYSVQLQYKQKQVLDQFKHLGKFDLPEADIILASANEYEYRNKLEFTFSNKRWLTKDEMGDESIKDMDALGFHIPGKFDKILDLTECHLQPAPSNEIRIAVKSFAKQNGLSFFNVRDQSGFLRNLIIRNTSIGHVMVIVSFYFEDKEKQELLLDFLHSKFPQISSLMYVINPKRNDTITDLQINLYKGNDYIIEQMEDLQFKIGPKSFYQTNSLQAYHLYCLVREYANLKGNEIVYDLYTGTGTIANFISRNASKVVGIEYVPEAVEDAFENSKLNNITNTVFYAGDMKDILNQDFINKNGIPDIIILDPPRAGVHPDVINALLLADAGKIVYVSCNAATQARDIQLLSEKYKVVKYRPVDMFPQTAHVENIALLIKK